MTVFTVGAVLAVFSVLTVRAVLSVLSVGTVFSVFAFIPLFPADDARIDDGTVGERYDQFALFIDGRGGNARPVLAVCAVLARDQP